MLGSFNAFSRKFVQVAYVALTFTNLISKPEYKIEVL